MTLQAAPAKARVTGAMNAVGDVVPFAGYLAESRRVARGQVAGRSG